MTDRIGAVVRLVIDGKDVTEVSALDYSSDVNQCPDVCNATLSPRNPAAMIAWLRPGQEVSVYTAHPVVNGGAEACRFSGYIKDIKTSGSRGGVDIKLTIADRGYRLTDCAPLWYTLKSGTYRDLFDVTSGKFIPKGIFKGLRFDNNSNRRLKLGMAGFQAAGGAAQGQALYTPIMPIQVQPGESYLDILTQYARRLNLLVGTSVDGYLQAWLPDYNRKPSYTIRLTARESNVMSFESSQTADKVYTDVICVGEAIGTPLLNSTNPNQQKRRGTVRKPDALPFQRRLTFADSEMQTQEFAQKMADWRAKKELYDGWTVTYEVDDWHQNGTWWESDQLVDVVDEINGISQTLYVSAVNAVTAKDKDDTCRITCRLPGLLSASWGEIPSPRSFAAATKPPVGSK